MKKMLIVPFLLACSCLFASVTHISTPELERLMERDKTIVILDARTDEYYDGVMLPGAKWVPCDTSDAKIAAAIPSKGTTVVVYCYSATCPATGRLIERLEKMGYTNILDYKPGLKEWKATGLKTVS